MPAAPPRRKITAVQASGATQNTTKKLVLQDEEIGEICKHAAATTGGPHQEHQAGVRTKRIVSWQKVGIATPKDKIFIHTDLSHGGIRERKCVTDMRNTSSSRCKRKREGFRTRAGKSVEA